MLIAVLGVEEANQQLDGSYENGIEDEFIKIADDKHIDYNQFQHDLNHGNGGKDSHLLVGYYVGIIGYAHHLHAHGEDGELIDPHSCCEAIWGNDQFLI